MKKSAKPLALQGDFTIAEAATLRETLQAAIQNPDKLPIDLSQVSRFDTIGLQLLVSAVKSSPHQATLFAHSARSPALARACEAIGLEIETLLKPTK